MNTFAQTIYPQNPLALNNQESKNLSLGEHRKDLQPITHDRDVDRIDLIEQFATAYIERTGRRFLDEHLHDVLRVYGRFPLDCELITQRPGKEGFPKESYGNHSLKSNFFGILNYASKNPLRTYELDTLLAGLQKAEQNFENQRSNPGHEAFVLLARTKKLLNEQRIQDARSTLEHGARLYPKDMGIARLLRAISPGQTTRVKSTAMANRNREIAWIRKHGIHYRGQWVAIRNDELLASAKTLRSVLEKLKQRELTDEEALIQYIVPK